MTPQDQADQRISDPEWTFSENPTRAIVDASVQAAEHSIRGRHTPAAYWTAVSIALSSAAGTEPGLVVTGMAEQYGIPLEPVGS